jgi:3-oxoacyl-[acyl-carrier-protein] synthase-1
MFIGATGLVCSVGLSAQSACAAIRARVAGFEETRFLNADQQFTIAAPVAGMKAIGVYAERLRTMICQSITDCLQSQPELDTEKVPLLLALPEAGRPGADIGSIPGLLFAVSESLGIRFHPSLSMGVTDGHTAGFVALRAARQLLTTAQASAVLVCGADSYLNRESLAWLGETSRLKTLSNSDGVIPGEAAAAVLLQREPGPYSAASILGLGFSVETASVLTEDPLLGIGLTNAARAALAETEFQAESVDFRIADVTGESYGFKEQALMVSRLLKSSKEKFPLWDCASCIGDVGAAVGMTQLIVAHAGFQKGYAPGGTALCCTSAVPGARAVALLQSQAE